MGASKCSQVGLSIRMAEAVSGSSELPDSAGGQTQSRHLPARDTASRGDDFRENSSTKSRLGLCSRLLVPAHPGTTGEE